MFLAVAIHHAAPEHVDDLLAHMNRVVRNVEGAPGLLEFGCWRESDGTRLIGFSRWDSRAAFEAALPRIGQFSDQRRPEWSTRPDEVLMLTPA
jgi:heme-degrading monooxygenase HmoA